MAWLALVAAIFQMAEYTCPSCQSCCSCLAPQVASALQPRPTSISSAMHGLCDWPGRPIAMTPTVKTDDALRQTPAILNGFV